MTTSSTTGTQRFARHWIGTDFAALVSFGDDHLALVQLGTLAGATTLVLSILAGATKALILPEWTDNGTPLLTVRLDRATYFAATLLQNTRLQLLFVGRLQVLVARH